MQKTTKMSVCLCPKSKDLTTPMTSHASDFVNAKNHVRGEKVRDEDLITYNPADKVSFNLST